MKYVTLFLFLLLLVQPSYAAAGMILPPVEAREFYFSPGAEYEWTWSISRAESMTTWLTGDLVPYAELDDPNQKAGPRDVTFSLKLPEELDPGLHILQLNAREEIEETSGVQSRAAVGGQIRIISLYPQPWVQARLKVFDTPENKTTNADIQLLSWSEVDTKVYAKITVYDEQRNELFSIRSDTIMIGPQERKTLRTPLPTKDLAPGMYRIKATVKGSSEDIELETIFRVGTLDVYLGAYSKELPTKSVNRFELEVISRWTSDVNNVYADISFAGMTERTPSINLRPADGGKLYTYFDMRDIVNDTLAEGTITVYFANGNANEFPITINITNALEPVNERPGFTFELNSITGLYLLLVLLVIINVVLLLRRKEK